MSVDGRLERLNEKGRLAPSLFAFGNDERLEKKRLSNYFLLWLPRM